ncbi:MAG: serine/threonine protein kinase [Deltaproteobacteria bacterium]|nr:serine/threonine protein kinase [Deltaproteobacteria bacterium]
MRACPGCRTLNPPGEGRCTACGTSIAEEELPVSLSDTVRASGAVSAVSAAATPVIRARPTPFTEADRTQGQLGDDPIVGAKLVGRYEVTRKIGEGGMGAVYEARHLLIGKRVAIKVLLDKYAQKADVVARLQQEARLASSIGHEHIVDITDFGETEDGRTFVVMEFLEGESLAHLLSREGPLAPARAVGIARQVAGALGAAHSKGIVHRDVKPENVFIIRRSERDFVKVVDFGISKAIRNDQEEGGGSSPRLTQTGMVLGTPLYMSPEQARGEDELDHRIDVYALGVILYEIITGEVPFQGTNYLNIISQVLSQEPKPPSRLRPDLGISLALDAVILRAMAKSCDHRYQSMAELDADLGKLENGEEVRAISGHLSTGGRLGVGPQAGKKRAIAWGAGVSVVVLGVALAVSRILPEPPPRQPATMTIATPPPATTVAVPEKPKIEMIVVRVTSDPPGAEVWWESVKKGKTPTGIELPKGDDQISLTLRLDGFAEASAKFYPTKDQEVPVTLKRLAEAAKPARPPKAKPKPPALAPSPPHVEPDRGPTSGGEIKPSPF